MSHSDWSVMCISVECTWLIQNRVAVNEVMHDSQIRCFFKHSLDCDEEGKRPKSNITAKEVILPWGDLPQGTLKPNILTFRPSWVCHAWPHSVWLKRTDTAHQEGSQFGKSWQACRKDCLETVKFTAHCMGNTQFNILIWLEEGKRRLSWRIWNIWI